MKAWKIVLTDGREEYIMADGYRLEGEQYVFESEGDTDVQFFKASYVIGIYEL